MKPGAAADEDPLPLQHPQKGTSTGLRAYRLRLNGGRASAGARAATIDEEHRADAHPAGDLDPDRRVPAVAVERADGSRPSGPPSRSPSAPRSSPSRAARRGGRVVRIPMIGAFTIGTKSPQRTTAAQTTGHGDSERRRSTAAASRSHDPEAREAAAAGSGRAASSTSTEPIDRADAEAREDPAGDVRVAVVARVREQRHGDARSRWPRRRARS